MSKKLLRDESGFTLIELMVVVAIIGVLSAIAVPNFKKYQAKAKQSEAKIQLAAIYTIEVGAMADYDSYASCLEDLGYDKPARGYYILGFAAEEPGNLWDRNGDKESCNSSAYVAPSVPLSAGAPIDVEANPQNAEYSIVSEDFQLFQAQATGNIESTNLDYWSITETKSIKNYYK
jgi:type IV pilus assembly protein PilA